MGGRYLGWGYPPCSPPLSKRQKGGIMAKIMCMGKKNFIGKLLEKGKINFWKKLGEKSPSIRVGVKEMSPPFTGVVYFYMGV
jgi:hypothetical protein